MTTLVHLRERPIVQAQPVDGVEPFLRRLLEALLQKHHQIQRRCYVSWQLYGL